MPGRTILVIDYDPLSVESTRKSLVEAGYRVEVATDGVEGLEAFERTRPDLVLIEPMVPKKHGFQVCREIKGSSRGSRVPVLITTAFYKGRRHRATAREHYGCDDYLEKPIAQEDLLAACRRWVEEPDENRALRVDVPGLGPAPLALDELTDDEIVARLDAMIEAATTMEAPEPATAVPERVETTATLVAPAVPAPVSSPSRTSALAGGAPAKPAAPMPRTAPQHAAAKAALPPASRPAARAAQAPPRPSAAAPERPTEPPRPEHAESRARTALASALDSGTTRAVVAATRPSGAPRTAPGSRVRGMHFAVGAAVLAGAAILTWRLTRPVVTDPFRDTGPAARASVEPEAARVDPRTEAAPREAWTPSAAPGPLPVETAPAIPTDEPPVETAAATRPVVESADAGRAVPPVRREPEPAATSAPAVPAPSGPPAETKTDVEGPADASAAIAAESGTAPAELPPVEPQAVEPGPVPTPGIERGTLVPLSEVEDAPVPIRRAAPSYPPMARSLRQQGTVTLRVLVDDSGEVEQVEILRGIDGRLLDDAAKRAARDWRYKPATVGGVPVKVWVTEQVVFRL